MITNKNETKKILSHLLPIQRDVERLALWVNAIDSSKQLSKELGKACKHIRATVDRIQNKPQM